MNTQTPGKAETKLGPVFLTPTDANHLHLCTNRDCERNYLTLRGSDYYVSAHFYRWQDGAFQLGQEFTEVTNSNGKHTQPASTYERRERRRAFRRSRIHDWQVARPS